MHSSGPFLHSCLLTSKLEETGEEGEERMEGGEREIDREDSGKETQGREGKGAR